MTSNDHDNGSPKGTVVPTASSSHVEKQASVLVFELLTLLIISLVFGKNLMSFAGFLMLLYLISQKLHLYLSNLARAQAAKNAAQAKEAQKRRSREVAIISAAVGRNIVQIYQQEKKKLDDLITSFEAREAALQAKEELISMIETEVEAAQLAKSQELKEKEKELVQKEKKFAKAQQIAKALAEESAKNENNNRMMIAVTPKIPKAVATTVSSSNSYTNNALFGLSFPFSEYDPVAPGFTCIGQTKKHQRCHNKRNSFELDALTELASWILCPRWHKSQCDEIARQWHRDLVSASAPLRSSQYGQQTPPSAYFSKTPSSADSFLSSGTSIFSSAGRSSISSISPFNSPLTPSSDAEFLKATSQNETNRPMGREGFPKDPARNLAPVFSAMSNK
ncbi:hypothetical protein V8E54_000784 [Elaphomyces granulatus]